MANQVLGHTELNDHVHHLDQAEMHADLETGNSQTVAAGGKVSPSPPNGSSNNDTDKFSTVSNQVSDAGKVPQGLDLGSVWAIIQTGLDLAALTLIHMSGDFRASVSIISIGLAVATGIRGAAVSQYWQEVGIIKSAINLVTGSRFGYSEHPNAELMRRQPLNVVASDPLTLHSIADVVQQSWSAYAVFVALLADREDDSAVLVVSAFVSCISMLIGIAIHLPYGHMVVMVSIYVIFSVVFFFYILIAREIGLIEGNSEWYTSDLTYGWVRFLGMFSLAFVSLAIIQNSGKRDGVPKLMLLFAFGLLVFDLAATTVYQLRPDLFGNDNRPIEEKRLVEAIISANIGCDLLMIAHGIANINTMKKFA
mmetsp:Transcript_2573/g.3400  ORF Transcript_2573/g.3400 Transcript_2573/m.3400 type:complete len:366 (+) Transcript_2573:184-1281(+)